MLEDALVLLHNFVVLTMAYVIIDQVIIRLGLVEFLLSSVRDDSETLCQPYKVVLGLPPLVAIVLYLVYVLIDFESLSVRLSECVRHDLLATHVYKHILPHFAYLNVHS